MSVALYMDQHVRAEITDGLRRRGIDVVTAFDDGAADWDDERILARATELGRVLFSQDRDLLAITRLWLDVGRPFSGLAYAHQRGITDGEGVRDLELLAKVYGPDDMRHRVEYLPYS